jgi:hypothetical protein
LLITLNDWRTIDASKHFTADNQSEIANTVSGGISKETLMQIVGLKDTDNVTATPGNGRGVAFVDATPPLATAVTISDNHSHVIITIQFDQPVLSGNGFILHGYDRQPGERDNYTFSAGKVTRGLTSNDVFDNGTVTPVTFQPTYTASVSNSTLTILVADNTSHDFSNYFSALSHGSSLSVSASGWTGTSNKPGDGNLTSEDPTFFINYDNITDINYNSWSKVEYFDAYLTDGTGLSDNRTHRPGQYGPRLVGIDKLVPKIAAAPENADNRSNVFLMEVRNHGLSIVKAFGTGADNGTHLMGSGMAFDAGPTTSGDVNNTTDNASNATQNDYPLYRFWNSAGTNAQDNGSSNNNKRVRAVISFAPGTVLKDTDNDSRAYIRSVLDNDNTSITEQVTTALMRQSLKLANGSSAGSLVNAGSVDVQNEKLVVGIPDYTFEGDNITADKTSVESDDVLVIDGIDINDIEYVFHISPPNVASSDNGTNSETIGTNTGDNLTLKVFRKVYLDVELAGVGADNKTQSLDLTTGRVLTFGFLENLNTINNVLYTSGNTNNDNYTSVNFTISGSKDVDNATVAKITFSNPTGTSDTQGQYVGDNSTIAFTATDFSGNSNTYSITLHLGHNQNPATDNRSNDLDVSIIPIHNEISSSANSSKKTLQAP